MPPNKNSQQQHITTPKLAKDDQKYPNEPPPTYEETMFNDEVNERFNAQWNNINQQPESQLQQQNAQYKYYSRHGGSTGYPGTGSQTYNNNNTTNNILK